MAIDWSSTGSAHCRCSNFGTLLKVVKQYFILLHILPNLQLALNLTGESEDPLMVTWDVIRKQGILNNTGMAMDRVPKAGILLNYIHIFNALILGELEVAEQSVQRMLSLKLQRLNGNHFSNYLFSVCDGLLGFMLQIERGVTKYKALAVKALKVLEKRSKTGVVDCLPILRMIQALQGTTLRQTR